MTIVDAGLIFVGFCFGCAFSLSLFEKERGARMRQMRSLVDAYERRIAEIRRKA